MSLPSSKPTKRKQLSGNERKEISDKQKSAYGTHRRGTDGTHRRGTDGSHSLMKFVSKNVSESNLDFENTNTSSTSLSQADAELQVQVQGLLSADQQVDDRSESVDPDVYANKQDTAEFSNNDPYQETQDTVNIETIEMETVKDIPRDDEHEVQVDKDTNDYDTDSKQTCLIDLHSDYPMDPALFEKIAIIPSLVRVIIEAGPCQPGFCNNRYEFASDDLGFKFKPNWYIKETKFRSVKRNWLVYSHRSQKMFFFVCC